MNVRQNRRQTELVVVRLARLGGCFSTPPTSVASEVADVYGVTNLTSGG